VRVDLPCREYLYILVADHTLGRGRLDRLCPRSQSAPYLLGHAAIIVQFSLLRVISEVGVRPTAFINSGNQDGSNVEKSMTVGNGLCDSQQRLSSRLAYIGQVDALYGWQSSFSPPDPNYQRHSGLHIQP
jgi:hypothetical protein